MFEIKLRWRDFNRAASEQLRDVYGLYGGRGCPCIRVGNPAGTESFRRPYKNSIDIQILNRLSLHFLGSKTRYFPKQKFVPPGPTARGRSSQSGAREFKIPIEGVQASQTSSRAKCGALDFDLDCLASPA